MKKVFVLMESFTPSFDCKNDPAYVNTIYFNKNRAMEVAEDLKAMHKKEFPVDFYTNWIVEKYCSNEQ